MWVASAWQQVAFENVNLVCFTYERIGHEKGRCMVNRHNGEKFSAKEDGNVASMHYQK